MPQIMGETTAEAGGKTWTLRLSLRGIATLQDEYGQNLEPIIGLKPGDLPHFGMCLRVVELALQRHHPDATADDAEEILAADMGVFGRVIAAAFPPAEEAKPGKRKAAA